MHRLHEPCFYLPRTLLHRHSRRVHVPQQQPARHPPSIPGLCKPPPNPNSGSFACRSPMFVFAMPKPHKGKGAYEAMLIQCQMPYVLITGLEEFKRCDPTRGRVGACAGSGREAGKWGRARLFAGDIG